MHNNELLKSLAGKELSKPVSVARVFRLDDPDYSYEFVRQEGEWVLVIDDQNGTLKDRETLKEFRADELVSVAVYRQTVLNMV